MTEPATERSPLERLLDVSIFAPLGFVLTCDETIAELATAGRKQLAFSRSLGRAALSTIAKGSTARRGRTTVRSEAAEPLPDYDSLTARTIVDRLPDCSEEQLHTLREREVGGKNRVTVLRAIDARLA